MDYMKGLQSLVSPYTSLYKSTGKNGFSLNRSQF